MRLVSDEPGVAGEQPLVSRQRAVSAAKDEQGLGVLQARLGAALTRLDAALSGLEASRARERRLPMDSTDSGTPSSWERIGAKETRRARQESERERRTDCRRAGTSLTIVHASGPVWLPKHH